MSATTGAPLAELLSRVRADLRDRGAGRSEVATAVAGPQASMVVLAVLPLLGIALGAAMGADPIGVLFGTVAGRALLCLGALFDVAGLLWTMRIIAGATR